MSAPAWWVDALTQTVYGIRRNTRGITDADRWDQPGIRAAAVKLLEQCSPADVARVMVAGADNPRMKTPGGITAPGPQWSYTTKATTKAPTFCPDHPQTPLTRCPCQRFAGTPKPDNFADLVQAARNTQED